MKNLNIQKKIQKVKKSLSNTEKIYQDLMGLIIKYSDIKKKINISSYSPPTEIAEGFYLMFLKRDEKEPQRRLQITEFSKNINLQDLIACFSDILDGHIKGINSIKEEKIH